MVCPDGSKEYDDRTCKTTKELQQLAGKYDEKNQGLYKIGHQTRCGPNGLVSKNINVACPNGLYKRQYLDYKKACKVSDIEIAKCNGSESTRNNAEGFKNTCATLRRDFKNNNLYKPNPIAPYGSYIGHQDAIQFTEERFRNLCSRNRPRGTMNSRRNTSPPREAPTGRFADFSAYNSSVKSKLDYYSVVGKRTSLATVRGLGYKKKQKRRSKKQKRHSKKKL